jgi:hypothetical protein
MTDAIPLRTYRVMPRKAHLRLAHDANDATRRLVQAGATKIDDPARWLRSHRAVVSDPVERGQLLAHATRSLWLHRAGTALMVTSVLVAQVGGDDTPNAGLLAFVLLLGLGLLLRRASGRPSG